MKPSTIPKTIIGGPRPPKETYNASKINNIDSQTTVTTNTLWCLSDNGISDLQSNSRNQLSITHKNRMKQLELLLNQEHQTNVTYKIQQVKKSNKFVHQEMETIMATVPQLSTKIQSQNHQLQQTIDDNTDFCRVTSETK
jgi:methyl-accepting chemotaxis protein